MCVCVCVFVCVCVCVCVCVGVCVGGGGGGWVGRKVLGWGFVVCFWGGGLSGGGGGWGGMETNKDNNVQWFPVISFRCVHCIYLVSLDLRGI